MPVRIACNIAYAMLVDGLDAKQRKDFDTQLHGWDDINNRATQALLSGGES